MIYGRKTKAAELATRLGRELREKRLPQGTPVMSARELALRFNISVVTANKILDLLEMQDVVYRVPQRGTFIKNDPPVIPEIVYAGFVPGPASADPLKDNAAELLFGHFHKLNIEPQILTYHTLCNPFRAEKILEKSNALLIDACFIDSRTIKTLWNYRGRIVVTGNLYIVDELPCSQVIPDCSQALSEFNNFSPFGNYKKILILEANHRNSTASAESVFKILKCLDVPEENVEIQQLAVANSAAACWSAFRYFSERRDLDEDTLIVSLSDYFSQGIKEAYRHISSVPDILSFDNLEQFGESSFGTPGFCSIDRQHGLMNQIALTLLCKQLEEKTDCLQVIKVPAKLIMRKSVKKLKVQPEK